MAATLSGNTALVNPVEDLRVDLQCYRRGREMLIEDPLHGTFFRLDAAESEIFQRLRHGHSLRQIVAEGLYPREKCEALLQQLQHSGLMRGTPDQRPATAFNPLSWIVWRIPLLRPQSLLRTLLPFVRPFTHPLWLILMVFLAAVASIAIARQFDLYLSTANYLTTPSGIAILLLALLLLKSGHELAHGLVATAHGVHVRQMGVLFILCWPLLYTDVTAAWKLPSRRQRMQIAFAGVGFELSVAVLAACGWLLLTDGYLRSLLFVLSGISLLTSLFINLNPFMRFDAYYALMDYWDLDNLQQQASESLTNWRRSWLWGISTELDPRLPQGIKAYACGALAWRWLIAINISFFCALLFGPWLAGLLACAFAHALLFRPLLAEYRWLRTNRLLRHWRVRALIAIATATLLATFLIPWPSTLQLPAILGPGDQQRIVATETAILRAPLPLPGHLVSAGEVVASLHSDDLEQKITSAEIQLKRLQTQLERLLSSGAQGGYRQGIQADISRQQTYLARLLDSRALLQTRAKASSRVYFSDDTLKPGDPVRQNAALLTLGSDASYQLELYIPHHSLRRLKALYEHGGEDVAASAEFAALQGQLHFASGERQAFNHSTTDRPTWTQDVPNILFDIYGGPIASRSATQADQVRLEPLDTWYHLSLPVAAGAHQAIVEEPITATVQLPAASLAWRALSWVVRTFHHLEE